MKRSIHKRGGFSLIEVALALLVVSVGLVAVIGMFPSGLDSGRKANEDTQTALFADYVLNTIRAMSASPNFAWSTFTDPTALQIPIAAPDMWDVSTATNKVHLTPLAQDYPNIVFASWEDKKIEELSINYHLTIASIPSISADRMLRAQLSVIPGIQGATNNPRVFYTDIFRGDLK